MDNRSLAHHKHPSTEEGPCACLEGVVLIGHLETTDEGEEVEAVPCGRCTR